MLQTQSNCKKMNEKQGATGRMSSPALFFLPIDSRRNAEMEIKVIKRDGPDGPLSQGKNSKCH